jgi:hypothetical protein
LLLHFNVDICMAILEGNITRLELFQWTQLRQQQLD